MDSEKTVVSTWYEIEDIQTIDSPAFVVYPMLVKENIRHAITMVGDVSRLRPHAKTNKSREATSLMIAEGITKFKCATIAEAEMLAQAKAKDILLAYQPLGPKLVRFISLIKAFPALTFSCLIDSATAASDIASACESHQMQLPFFLDINVGMNRTGVTPEKALSVYKHCLSMTSLQPVGLHVYDGHIHDSNVNVRTERTNHAFEQIHRLKKELEEAGWSDPVIIAGGSPTFPVHAAREGVECSPGTFVYWDRNYQLSCGEQPFRPAALVVSRVISLPTETTICLDLGHKSIASENDINHRVHFLNAPGLKCLSHSEEHLVVEAPVGHCYNIGDVLYGVPFHICPTAALYERAVTIENGRAVGEWKMIARDRKISW